MPKSPDTASSSRSALFLVTYHLASFIETTMFKSAATKIAHNTTIPSLGGNKDLRPLQDLITAEKAIVTSYVTSISLSELYNVEICHASDLLLREGCGTHFKPASRSIDSSNLARTLPRRLMHSDTGVQERERISGYVRGLSTSFAS